MFSKVFLAQTPGETAIRAPKKLAYMALHFSSFGKGLSNFPTDLPKGSILLLDDSLEPEDHDPQIVVDQLTQLVTQFSPQGILLDFQRPKTTQLENMAACISQALPCPVCVTEGYASSLKCPVFLSPPPVNKALADYIGPWKNRGVFLEIAPDCVAITVTENGSQTSSVLTQQSLPLEDKRLHCHYNVEVLPDKAIFTICRYKADLQSLVQEAESLGVLGCVGLYGELHD